MKQIVSLFLFFIILVSNAQAKRFDLLEPICVEIEQKGDNPSVAKKKALNIAARFAFQDALETQLNCHAKIGGITDNQISNCLYEYMIEDEKYSDSIYISKITYRFNKQAVTELLINRGIEFSKKILGSSTNQQKQQNTKKRKILMRTCDFLNFTEQKANFDYDIEKISQKRVVLIVSETYLGNIQMPYINIK